MKPTLLFLLCFISLSGFTQYTQTRTASNIVINHKPENWVDRTAASFSSDDNIYAYTTTSSGQHPVFFDHFGFEIPANATITKLVCTVKKFKTGRSEVKDLAGVTWFLARCYCSFGDCNCNYGPSMDKTDPWPTTETTVIYEQPGSGSYKKRNSSNVLVTYYYDWKPEMINDIMFGFSFNPTINIKGGGAAIYIDQVAVTVHYSLPATVASRAAEESNSQPFKATAVNTTTHTSFVINTQGSSDKPLTIQVTDVSGRLIETKRGIAPNQSLRIGEHYATGLYFVEVAQGSERKVLKLIKH